MRFPRTSGGFTLIELLVVIAIIGILAAIALAALGQSRVQAQIVRTQSELRQIKTSIVRLELDTQKSAGGCPVGVYAGSGNEFSLSSLRAGLWTAPTNFSVYGVCQWTAADAANWKGPYMNTPTDPWGNEYYYDSDYYPYQDNGGACTNPYPPGVAFSVVVSGGPNGVNGGASAGGPYDCDDIFLILDGS
jgi:general secretion pathway protein G